MLNNAAFKSNTHGWDLLVKNREQVAQNMLVNQKMIQHLNDAAVRYDIVGHELTFKYVSIRELKGFFYIKIPIDKGILSKFQGINLQYFETIP